MCPFFCVTMHYMVDPPSERILRPSLRVMDCELRDWACSFYMRMLTDFDYPKYMVLQTVSRFELDICGQTGRKLWITVYDEISGHGFAEEQSDLFLEAFIEEFRSPFWNLIPASKNPHRDQIEKSDRLGVEISAQPASVSSQPMSEDDCGADASHHSDFYHQQLSQHVPEKATPQSGVCVRTTCVQWFLSLKLQGSVALASYHTQRSCGCKWEARPDQSCVPAKKMVGMGT